MHLHCVTNQVNIQMKLIKKKRIFPMLSLCFYLQGDTCIKCMMNNAMREVIRPASEGKWCLLWKIA